MNLTKFFNFSFLKENLKRSKAIVLLCIFLIPVINVTILLMRASGRSYFIPEINDISLLSIFAMYILPLILAITLFSFVYKRKSSDFIMSLPITKKQIFATNMLSGIGIIVLMNLINLILTFICTFIFKNILIDYRMIFDTFLIWTISYIFVFTSSSIAISLASNKITTVVVTLLILFFVPFVHSFVSMSAFTDMNQDVYTYCDSESCKPIEYDCYDSKECLENEANHLYIHSNYKKVEKADYTIPYALIATSLFSLTTINMTASLLKMTFLSIIYIIVGLIIFERKKIEVVETSFKSEKAHIFVRSLTTVPILCLYYSALRYSIGEMVFTDFFAIVFLLVIIITYVIVYDLITRKKVLNIFKSIASLIVVGIIVIFVGEISINKKPQIIKVNDIKSLTFEEITNHNEIPSSVVEGTTKNKDVINYVMSIHLSNSSTNSNNDPVYSTIKMQITANQENYEFYIYLTESEVKELSTKIKLDRDFTRERSKINNKDVFSITIGNDFINIDKKNALYQKILTYYSSSNSSSNATYYLSEIKLYTYNNYEIKETDFNAFNNKSLVEDILNYYNHETSKKITKENISISYYSIGNETELFDYYYIPNSKLSKFIYEHKDEKVDITKPYLYIRFNSYDIVGNYSYYFITNRVDELMSLIPKADNTANDGEVYTDEKLAY